MKEEAKAESLRGGGISKSGINILDFSPKKSSAVSKIDKKALTKQMKQKSVLNGGNGIMGTLVSLNEEDDDDSGDEVNLDDYMKEQAKKKALAQQEANDGRLHELEKHRLEDEIKLLIKKQKDKDSQDSDYNLKQKNSGQRKKSNKRK